MKQVTASFSIRVIPKRRHDSQKFVRDYRQVMTVILTSIIKKKSWLFPTRGQQQVHISYMEATSISSIGYYQVFTSLKLLIDYQQILTDYRHILAVSIPVHQQDVTCKNSYL